MREMACEPGRQGAIDHTVIVRHRERQHQPRLEGLAIPDRRHSRAHDPEDRNLGCVDEWREGRAANSSEARDREGGALNVGSPELAVAGLLRHRPKLLADVANTLTINI